MQRLSGFPFPPLYFLSFKGKWRVFFLGGGHFFLSPGGSCATNVPFVQAFGRSFSVIFGHFECTVAVGNASTSVMHVRFQMIFSIVYAVVDFVLQPSIL